MKNFKTLFSAFFNTVLCFLMLKARISPINFFFMRTEKFNSFDDIKKLCVRTPLLQNHAKKE